MNFIENNLIDAPIITDPFPHIVVDNIFSNSDYFDVMNEIPKCEFLGKAVFPDKNTSVLDRKSSSFFNDLFVYIEDKLGELLIRKFGIKNPNHSIIVSLQRSTSNYKINPHTDSSFKLATWIIYLPIEGIDEEAGTYICTPKKGIKVAGDHGKLQPWSKFDSQLVKCNHNRLFAFPVSSNSWHAADMKGKNDGRIILRGFVFDTTMWTP